MAVNSAFVQPRRQSHYLLHFALLPANESFLVCCSVRNRIHPPDLLFGVFSIVKAIHWKGDLQFFKRTRAHTRTHHLSVKRKTIMGILGDFATSGPKIMREAIFDPLWDFLFLGKPQDCDRAAGYKPAWDGAPYCIGDNPPVEDGWQVIGTWTKDGGQSSIKWLKHKMVAENANQASARSCQPGTTPWNGMCISGCPKNFKPDDPGNVKLPPEIAPPAGQTGGGDNDYAKRTRVCRSECEGYWHPLTYDGAHGGGARPTVQMIPTTADFCFHPPYAADATESTHKVSGFANANDELLPYYFITTEAKWNVSHPDFPKERTYVRPIPKDCTAGKGDWKNQPECFEANGFFAERALLRTIGSELNRPCEPPNVVTPSGGCKRPCSQGYKMVGENCVATSMPCPENGKKPDKDDGTFCVPKIVKRPYSWSFMQFIFVLALLIGIVAVFVGIIFLLKR